MAKSIDRYITMRSGHYVRSLCNPLNGFGIIGFNHDLSFPKGELSMLTTHPSVFQIWFNNRLPAICTDENGRTLTAGVYLDSYLIKNYIVTDSSLGHFKSLFNATRSLHIVERHEDSQSLYSFLFTNKQSDHEFFHYVLNRLSMLNNFIEQYKSSSQDLIEEAKKPENRILLPLESITEKMHILQNLILIN